jgi:Nucleoside transporter
LLGWEATILILPGHFVSSTSSLFFVPSRSMFPAVYAQGLMSGQGVAGILASVAAIIVKAAIPDTDDDSQKTAAIVYFVFSASTLAACIASYIVLMRMPFTQYHLNKAGASTTARADARTLGVEVATPRLGGASGPGSLEITAASASHLPSEEGPNKTLLPLLDNEAGVAKAATEGEEDDDDSALSLTTWGVLQKIAVLATSVFLVFFITFLVFPSVAPFGIDFKGQGLGKLSISSDWWATILLCVFNVCDTCGRILPAFLALLKGKGLLLATILRSGLIVILVGCARSWSSGFNDLLALLIFIAFSFTNGYFASLAMMNGPQQVKSKDRQQAGFMMSLFLQLGILAGSQASFGLKPPQTG